MDPITVYIEENRNGLPLYLLLHIPYLGAFPLLTDLADVLLKGRSITAISGWEYVSAALSLVLIYFIIKYRNTLFPPLYVTFSDANIVAFLKRRKKAREYSWKDIKEIAIKPTEIHILYNEENADPVIVKLPSYKVGREAKKAVREIAAAKDIAVTV